MSDPNHWQDIYARKAPEGVSWFRPHLDISLDYIRRAELPKDAHIVDVGGGASTLVDDLLEEGYVNVSVLDLASSALGQSKDRLGERASLVRWVVGDVTTPLLPAHSVDFWHDRAVFHFLTNPAARSAYIEQVKRAVKPGGHVSVATFGLDGPETCSGLPVNRYDAAGIHAVFGEDFDKLAETSEQHETPWGSTQAFVYCFCRRH